MQLVAKCFYFYSWTHELVGNSGAIRGDLFAALRTSTLHDDDAGQAVVLNLLFRNFLNHNLVDQAQRLASKTVFPQTAPNSEAARYLYYQGRVDAIQLEYTRAYSNLELAIRKAPKGAIGFLQAVRCCGAAPGICLKSEYSSIIGIVICQTRMAIRSWENAFWSFNVEGVTRCASRSLAFFPPHSSSALGDEFCWKG